MRRRPLVSLLCGRRLYLQTHPPTFMDSAVAGDPIRRCPGPALRTHLPELVCCMLEYLSSMEDRRLNYVKQFLENIVGHHAALKKITNNQNGFHEGSTRSSFPNKSCCT